MRKGAKKGDDNMGELFDGYALYAALGIFAAAIIIICSVHGRTKKRRRRASAPRRAELAVKPDAAHDKHAEAILLSAAKRKADAAYACKPYYELFEGLARPFQMLLALAKGREGLEPALIKEYFDESVCGEIRSALQRSGASVDQGKLVLPEKAEPFDYAAFASEAAGWDIRDINDAEKRFLGDADSHAIWIKMRNICGSLGGTLESLANNRTEALDFAFIKDAAAAVSSALKANGIYAFYASDNEIKTSPELTARFVAHDTGALKYPGLFVVEQGRPVVLCHYLGTR